MGQFWFETVFQLRGLFSETGTSSKNLISKTLTKILKETTKLNPEFLRGGKGFEIETCLDFQRDWGLGSSSTLINNIAQWAEVDAYQLLWNAFSGSGYDIACAQHNSPILYRLKNEKPIVEPISFNPPFLDNLYFIHLDKKQNSREGIAKYRKMEFDGEKLTNQISEITENVISCSNLSEFERLLLKHEQLISNVLQLPTVKAAHFPDYNGAIKSLGAWGGDFILAAGNEDTPKYFKNKGFETVLPYSEMVLKNRD